MLVGGLLLAPFAWLLEMQISYSLMKWACANDRHGTLLAVPLGSLALIGVATWMCWSSWIRLRDEARATGDWPVDRSRLLALSGLAMNALVALLILTSFVPRYFLSPCE